MIIVLPKYCVTQTYWLAVDKAGFFDAPCVIGCESILWEQWHTQELCNGRAMMPVLLS